MQEIRNYLEIIYFLTGPAIALIAYYALGQIKTAKEQIIEQKRALVISSKRDSLKLTADQVTIYCDKIIPLQNIFNEKINSEGVSILEKFKVEFEENKIKIIPPQEALDFKNLDVIAKELVNVSNAMESFSTYFATGVADEKIAYLSLGSTFCNSMKILAPVLIPISNDGRRFSATLRLYFIWGTRLDNENLVKQKKEIEEKLKSKKTILSAGHWHAGLTRRCTGKTSLRFAALHYGCFSGELRR